MLDISERADAALARAGNAEYILNKPYDELKDEKLAKNSADAVQMKIQAEIDSDGGWAADRIRAQAQKEGREAQFFLNKDFNRQVEEISPALVDAYTKAGMRDVGMRIVGDLYNFSEELSKAAVITGNAEDEIGTFNNILYITVRGAQSLRQLPFGLVSPEESLLEPETVEKEHALALMPIVAEVKNLQDLNESRRRIAIEDLTLRKRSSEKDEATFEDRLITPGGETPPAPSHTTWSASDSNVPSSAWITPAEIPGEDHTVDSDSIYAALAKLAATEQSPEFAGFEVEPETGYYVDPETSTYTGGLFAEGSGRKKKVLYAKKIKRLADKNGGKIVDSVYLNKKGYEWASRDECDKIRALCGAGKPFLLNLGSMASGGTHWTGAVVKGKTLLYSDPFGTDPMRGFAPNFLREQAAKAIENRRCFQRPIERNKLCGYYAMCFAKAMRSMPEDISQDEFEKRLLQSIL